MRHGLSRAAVQWGTVVKRVSSSSSEVRRKLDRFRAIRNDKGATREFALGIIESEANPELLAAALRALGENVSHEDGPILRELYHHFADSGRKRDAGGQLRGAILGALWHLRDRDDIPLALEASRHREPSLNGDGELIRAAGLALLGVLDAEVAAYRAIAMLGLNDASPMSGEPALTAARLLANLGQREALAMYALGAAPAGDVFESIRSRRASLPDVTAESLRGLAGVPADRLQPILERFAQAEDEVILLGLCDLLVSLDPDPLALELTRQLLRTASEDLYAVLATSIVASRRTELIAIFVESLTAEVRQPRLKIALDALHHAPQTPEVEAAMAQLVARTTTEPTLADLADTFDEDEDDD